MTSFGRMMRMAALALALGAWIPATAAEDAEGAPAVGESGGDGKPMTREERLKQHEERVRRIIEERRKARLAQQQQQQQQGGAAAPTEGVPNDGNSPSPDQANQQGGGQRPPQQQEPPQELDPDKVPFGSMILLVSFRTLEESKAEQLDVVVRQHDRFVSDIRLRNEASAPFDRVRVALKYDKRFLKPLKIYDNEVRKAASEEPTFSVNERDSVMLYEAKFAEPRHNKDLPVLRIAWEALLPTEHTSLSFRFATGDTEAGEHTAVYSKGENVLGDKADPLDGALGGGILILKPFVAESESQADILQGKKEELLGRYMEGVGVQSPAGIRLVGPDKPPAVGETFDVELQLANPGGAVIDALAVFVTFDPKTLQVVDDDRGNWIRRGVNIHDGLYRLDYPFDYHKRNEVDNGRGLIQYAMSLGDALTLPSGTFAKIKFRAVAPAELTSVDLVQSRKNAGTLTSLRCFGFEMFSGDPRITTPAWRSAVLEAAASGPAVASAAGEGGEAVAAPPPFLFDERMVQ